MLRLVFGLFFVAHGVNKVVGGLDGTAKWFAGIGMRWPAWQARLAATTEIGAGLLFAAGLFLPLSAAGIVGVMLVAIVVAHLKAGFFVFAPGQGWEYCASIAAVAIAVGFTGPGRWSVDHLLDIGPDTWGGTWAGGIIAVVLGAGAAGLQLATSYRPGVRS